MGCPPPEEIQDGEEVKWDRKEKDRSPGGGTMELGRRRVQLVTEPMPLNRGLVSEGEVLN